MERLRLIPSSALRLGERRAGEVLKGGLSRETCVRPLLAATLLRHDLASLFRGSSRDCYLRRSFGLGKSLAPQSSTGSLQLGHRAFLSLVSLVLASETLWGRWVGAFSRDKREREQEVRSP